MRRAPRAADEAIAASLGTAVWRGSSATFIVRRATLQVRHHVIRADDRVPASGHHPIQADDVCKRSSGTSDGAMVAGMRIGRLYVVADEGAPASKGRRDGDRTPYIASNANYLTAAHDTRRTFDSRDRRQPDCRLRPAHRR
ncbi:hypothetical protein SPHINGOT1_120308 [Sphingomonas sp. T1]|nr:hypothetical protein SPHINGOT1_120308 [Sphingomonas sp. T1]